MLRAVWVPAARAARAALRAAAARASLPASVPTTMAVVVALSPAIRKRALRAGWCRSLKRLRPAIGPWRSLLSPVPG